MSLILEALKKSEAKRHLGEVPNLGTPFASTRRRLNLLPYILASIFVASILGWWLYSTPNPSSTPDSTAMQPTVKTGALTQTATANPHATPASNAASDSATKVTPGAMFSSKPRLPTAADHLPREVLAVPPATPFTNASSAAGFGPRPPTTTTVATNTNPAAANSATPVAPAFSTNTKPAVTAAKTPTPVSAPVSPPTTPTVAAKTTAAATIVTQSAPIQPVTNPAVSATTVAHVAATGNAAATAATTSNVQKSLKDKPVQTPGVANASDTPMLYYELPYALRKDLPPLTLSMHVYGSDPAQRFVIINDARQVEGDTLTGGNLVLREIRPDGVVLELRGQRFLLPRSGN